MGRLETTIFASLGGVCRCEGQAFFDKLLSTCNRMAASSYVPPKRKKAAALIKTATLGVIILLLVRRLFFFCRRAAVTEYIDLADENAPIHCLHFYHPLGYWIDN